MFSLATISKMNTRAAIGKARIIAKAMNTPSGHAKSAEKGRLDHHFIDPLKTKLGGVDNQKLPRISSVGRAVL